MPFFFRHSVRVSLSPSFPPSFIHSNLNPWPRFDAPLRGTVPQLCRPERDIQMERWKDPGPNLRVPTGYLVVFSHNSYNQCHEKAQGLRHAFPISLTMTY